MIPPLISMTTLILNDTLNLNDPPKSQWLPWFSMTPLISMTTLILNDTLNLNDPPKLNDHPDSQWHP